MRMNSPIIGTALGAAVTITAIAAGSLAHAANPFQSIEFTHGYVLSQSHEGKCGEGKCGANKPTAAAETAHEGKCGEGKCGAGKKDEVEAQEDEDATAGESEEG